MRFDEIAVLNPATSIKKGQTAAFLDMATLPQHGRDVVTNIFKTFSGSGSRFLQNDTLIARITPCLENGKGAMVSFLENDEVGFGSTEFIVARAHRASDAKFVYYTTRSNAFREAAISRMEGTSGRQRVAWQQIANIEITDLPPREREVIGNTLGVLDDKIEANRKASAILEEMARALYRSWFVDFDPVHARAQGRAPAHMDPATAALFPDSFGDDELPEGWETVPYLDLVEIISGGTPKTTEQTYWNGAIPWYSVVDAPPTGQVFVHQTEKSITQAGFEGSAVKLVPTGTTIISARGTVGKLAIAGQNMVFNQSCYGLQGRTERRNAFVYFATERAIAHLQSMSHGSVFSTITRKTFEGLELTHAPREVQIAFEKMGEEMLDRIHSFGKENQTLAALRDALLPRLMSGELRVGAAREMVEEAV